MASRLPLHHIVPIYASLHEASRLTGAVYTPFELSQLIESGQLQGFRVSGACVVKMRDVERLIEARPWPRDEPVPEARIGP